MATLSFEKITFHDMEDKIQVSLLKHYYFDIPKEELERIAPFSVDKNSITFEGISEQSASNKFNFLFDMHIKDLKTRFNKRNAVYVHKGSGIPLIGCLYFGIVDKGTDIIEVKPNTGCNARCEFCSVGEGPDSKWLTDYIVQAEYLIEELKKLVEFKKENIDVYINPHGEPLLYSEIVELVRGIRAIELVREIHIITNGMLLTEKLVDEFADAGLSCFNISMHALDPDKAKNIMGVPYDVERMKNIITYARKKLDVIITPVMMFNVNDDQMEKIIGFCKSIGCDKVGIQNFLENRRGRNPAKEISWERFHSILKEWEQKHGMKLIVQGTLKQTKELPKPFKRDDIVQAEIVCNGRARNERLAVAGNRCIMVPRCDKAGKIRVKIRKSLHNVFVGEIVG